MKLFRQKQVAEPFRYVAGWNERRSQTGWWHSFDLPDGTHIPGVCLIDGLKKRIGKFPIPQDLRGKRALDIGTWDGWFAFELERRGAEVVATDVWHNPRFIEMRERLGSRVRYERLNVYDMSPERLGKFDIVLFFGVLYHLKHPLLALEKVCELTTEMAAIDSFALRNQHFPGADDKAILEFYENDEMGGQTDNWVGPSVKAIEAMCRTAGFPRAEFQGFTDHSACFACYRHWEPAGRSDPPELLSAFHHTDYGVNFRRSTEEYVTIWFKHPPSLNLSIQDVKPSIEGFGVRPIAVNLIENDIWQASFMVPPGLNPGWNKVDVRVGRSAPVIPYQSLSICRSIANRSKSPALPTAKHGLRMSWILRRAINFPSGSRGCLKMPTISRWRRLSMACPPRLPTWNLRTQPPHGR